MRFPVAAKIALQSAGAIGGTPLLVIVAQLSEHIHRRYKLCIVVLDAL
jgi:hypothetical protein